MRKKFIVILTALVLLLTAGIFSWLLLKEDPREFMKEYFRALEEKDYEGMYEMLSDTAKEQTSLEDFISRNKNIYEGIEAGDFRLTVQKAQNGEGGKTLLPYEMHMDTVAGKITVSNEAVLSKNLWEGYSLDWNSGLIFPDLKENDKVQVITTEAERGNIYDRNHVLLAGLGDASSVGIVPGKMAKEESRASQDLQKTAELLGMSVDGIQAQLEASWVREDSFVPLKTIEKPDLLGGVVDTADQEAALLQEQLLEIDGIMITDTQIRSYPLKEKAAHLTGYVQQVTAEDLEEHPSEGYTANSVIGRSGAESLYEKKLKGTDGYEIVIVDASGEKKEILAAKQKQDGEDIVLTVDARLQELLYDQYQEDGSCSVVINPKTGEVLALVSTPSYDPNLFFRGMSQEQWDSYNGNEMTPMQNRFRGTWCPGSSFKPIIGAIGLTRGLLDPDENFGQEGLSWQKDESWGDYYVTTLHDEYENVNLENALIYSDNIYFAKAALHMGSQVLKEEFDRLGFQETVPFDIQMTESSYSNSGDFDSEIQLADTGYGQGQMMMNPLHLACLYSAFVNEGNVIQPYLIYQEENPSEYWIENAFTREAAEIIKRDLIQVVEDPSGTAHGCRIEGISLAAKTGTAEIKLSQEDTDGTELGWLAAFTTEESDSESILLLTMAEDVKERGGSGYVVEKSKEILEAYLKRTDL